MNNKQRGMTFIEVLVALVIMVTGILGAVAMQATAKKGSFDAMQRSIASSLAQDILERMRGNDSATLANYAATNYGVGKYKGYKVASCKTLAGCVSDDMRKNDQYEWDLALLGENEAGDKVGGLVNAKACISVNNNAVTVVITWKGKEKIITGSTEGCGSTGKVRRQVLVEAFVY